MISVDEMRKSVAMFDGLVENFAAIGCKVEEVSGYSNRPYYYIGVKPPKDYPKNVSWLFTADSLEQFMRMTEVYFIGLYQKTVE